MQDSWLRSRRHCQVAFVRTLTSAVPARCSYYCQTASDDAGSCGFGSQFADSEGNSEQTDGVDMPAGMTRLLKVQSLDLSLLRARGNVSAVILHPSLMISATIT